MSATLCSCNEFYKSIDSDFREVLAKRVGTKNPQNESFIYIEHVPTGDVYTTKHQNSPEGVASTCAMIALGTPFFTLGKMIVNILRLPVAITVLVLETIYNVGVELSQAQFKKSIAITHQGIFQICDTCVTILSDVVRAPFFGIKLELAALSGLLMPYSGRRKIAIVEKDWQNRASYKEDPKKDVYQYDVYQYIINPPPVFLASCCQVRGNTKAIE